MFDEGRSCCKITNNDCQNKNVPPMENGVASDEDEMLMSSLLTFSSFCFFTAKVDFADVANYPAEMKQAVIQTDVLYVSVPLFCGVLRISRATSRLQMESRRGWQCHYEAWWLILTLE